LVCVCFGLRISECLALRWSDVDWLNGRLRVERGIVERNVDDVKTDDSRKSLAIAPELLDQLKVWKQATEFPADSDWIFASPIKIGRLPYSYTGAYGGNWTGQAKQRVGTHGYAHIPSFLPNVDRRDRDPHRSAAKTHAAEDMREAHGKIVRLALQRV
jgi:integrase